MKQFDLEEKKCIEKICKIAESKSGVLTNVFEDVLFGHGIAFDLARGAILYDIEKYENKIEDILLIQKIIIKRALLIKYLERNNYLYIIIDSVTEPLSQIGDSFKTSILQELPTDIADILRRTTYLVYIDSSLKDFISNNFKTIDDISIEEAKEQTKLARCTFKAAVISLLLSIVVSIIPFFISPSQEQVEAIMLDVDSIYNTGKYMETQLDNIIKNSNYIVISNDSIIQLEKKQTNFIYQINDKVGVLSVKD
jgi:hypothetical protein